MVLQSMSVYCASIFDIPAEVCRRIDQICNRFLWTEMEERKRMDLVNQEKVYNLKIGGGLRLRDLKIINLALKSKISYSLSCNEDRNWVKICKAKYLEPNTYFLKAKTIWWGSSFWNDLVKTRLILWAHTIWRIDDGSQICFWDDYWLDLNPLRTSFVDLANWASNGISKRVSSYIEIEERNHRWMKLLPASAELRVTMDVINHRLKNTQMHDGVDKPI